MEGTFIERALDEKNPSRPAGPAQPQWPRLSSLQAKGRGAPPGMGFGEGAVQDSAATYLASTKSCQPSLSHSPRAPPSTQSRRVDRSLLVHPTERNSLASSIAFSFLSSLDNTFGGSVSPKAFHNLQSQL